MGTDSYYLETKLPTDDTSSQCSHSDGKDIPVCWDCAEEGHIRQKFDTLPSSPTWENFKRMTKGLRLPHHQQEQQSPPDYKQKNPYKHASIPFLSTPEVRPPEEGIEVFHAQPQQPGLEVVAGPRVVSPEDKFRKVIAVQDVSNEKKDGLSGGEEEEEKENKAGRIYGLRRRTFWVVVACALLVLMAVVLGVAVGVTQRNKAMQSTALSMSSNGDQEPSPSPSANTPSPSPSPTTTSTPSSPSSSCLGPNESTYTDPSTGSQFRIECATAHEGKDIANHEADSMEACVGMCAGDASCAGAVWFDAGPQGTDLNYCWLKSRMDDGRRETGDAQSVVRL
ncbi:hypothetical protein F4810DRAFT_662528 [Camillea tinctor]|nr:hypothetical protein F4810DRAFT_662528 [Camillea tinctor]